MATAQPPHTGLSFTPTTHQDIYTDTNPRLTNLAQPGKIVLVTGSGRSIGRSIALRYAEAGVAGIVLMARTTTDLDNVEKDVHEIDNGISVLKLATDITNVESVAKAAETFRTWSAELNDGRPRLDVLVNNAGLPSPWALLADSDPVEWWRTWEVSVFGTFLMLRSFIPLVVDTKTADGLKVDIINITSIGAHMAMPNMSAYQTSRLAILRLSEFVLAEYGQTGINVFSVHPGGVVSQLTANIPNGIEGGWFPDTPELAGGFVCWLTKEDRSWLNGRYLSSAWDVKELEGQTDAIVKEDKLKIRMVV